MENLVEQKINEVDSNRQLAVRVLSNADAEQKRILGEWAGALLTIRHSDASVIKKGREAIRLTAKNSVIFPLLKIIAKELKIDRLDATKIKFGSKKSIFKSIKSFWSNRSFPIQMGVGVFTATAIFFGSQGAGIAALGTAIGLPLCVVTGIGATFLGVLYEEATGRKFDAGEKEGDHQKASIMKLRGIFEKLKSLKK